MKEFRIILKPLNEVKRTFFIVRSSIDVFKFDSALGGYYAKKDVMKQYDQLIMIQFEQIFFKNVGKCLRCGSVLHDEFNVLNPPPLTFLCDKCDSEVNLFWVGFYRKPAND